MSYWQRLSTYSTKLSGKTYSSKYSLLNFSGLVQERRFVNIFAIFPYTIGTFFFAEAKGADISNTFNIISKQVGFKCVITI